MDFTHLVPVDRVAGREGAVRVLGECPVRVCLLEQGQAGGLFTEQFLLLCLGYFRVAHDGAAFLVEHVRGEERLAWVEAHALECGLCVLHAASLVECPVHGGEDSPLVVDVAFQPFHLPLVDFLALSELLAEFRSLMQGADKLRPVVHGVVQFLVGVFPAQSGPGGTNAGESSRHE